MANIGGLDQNSRRTLSALSSVDNTTIVNCWADPTTHRLLVDLPPASTGITSINADTTATQTLTTGTTGTDFAIVDNGSGDHKFNLPDASATSRGVITTGTQTIAGTKTFSSTITGSISGNSATSTTAPSTAVLVDQTSGQTIGLTGSRLTKLWATDITVTNAIAGSISGNAATVTTNANLTGVVTSTGNATAIANGAISNAMLANSAVANLSGTNTGDNAANSTYTTLANTISTANSWTATQTFRQIIDSNNAITASGNAATVPITYRLNTVTNNSAATLTITLTTTSAVDGQMTMVRILDATAVAQTISWVNTENSTVTAPTTSNGSTTLPLTVGFQYNYATSKWRTIAKS